MKRRLVAHAIIPAEMARKFNIPVGTNDVAVCTCIDDVTREHWTMVADAVAFEACQEHEIDRLKDSELDSASIDELQARAYGRIVERSRLFDFAWETPGWPEDWKTRVGA
jgi:hypothetical protein